MAAIREKARSMQPECSGSRIAHCAGDRAAPEKQPPIAVLARRTGDRIDLPQHRCGLKRVCERSSVGTRLLHDRYPLVAARQAARRASKLSAISVFKHDPKLRVSRSPC